MANLNRPKGLSPVQNGDGSPWNQQVTLYLVRNDASNTYAIGDVVTLAALAGGGGDADGISAVTKWTSTSSTLPVGVIVGIRVADAGVSLVGSSLSLEKAYLPVSSGAHYVYVVDDPKVIYEVQGDSTVWAATDMNRNADLTVTANQTTLAQSSPYSSVVATGPGTANTLPLQILGLVQRVDNAYGAYAVLRVRLNISMQTGSTTGRTGL